MKSYKIFTINPGSTSTKIALFQDDNIPDCNLPHKHPES